MSNENESGEPMTFQEGYDRLEGRIAALTVLVTALFCHSKAQVDDENAEEYQEYLLKLVEENPLVKELGENTAAAKGAKETQALVALGLREVQRYIDKISM